MKDKQKIFIDCQVFQSPALYRGMGRYSLFFLETFLKSRRGTKNNSKVSLVFNKSSRIPGEIEELIKKYKEVVIIKKLPLIMPSVPNGDNIKDIQVKNQKIIDSLYTPNVKAIYLILSLFIDQVVSSFPSDMEKAVIVYDVIPYQYPERYREFSGFFDNFYFPRFETLFQADVFFVISETVASDLSVYLGIDSSKIVNIDGGLISRTRLGLEKPKNIEGIDGDYVLMPTGDELRKNNLRSTKAFEIFLINNPELNIKLITTSNYRQPTKEALSMYSPNIIFTGNIKEEELAWLYKNAKVVLFASEYEGLGLPILEGAEFDKPIVCSDIPVFREISDLAFYYCDPMDAKSISKAIGHAFNQVDWANKKENYKGILAKYTWENTVNKALDTTIHGSSKTGVRNLKKRKKIAMLIPNPTGFSAIGKVVQESHYSFKDDFDIDYYFDTGPTHIRDFRTSYLPELTTCYNSTEFSAERYKKYDEVIYHIGNSDYHINTLQKALYLPGYSIMHDTFLDGIYTWLDKLEIMPPNRILAEKKLNKLSNSKKTKYITSLVNSQKGIIVHSDFAKAAIEKLCSFVPTLKANLPVDTSLFNSQNSLSSKVSIGLAGILADVKGLSIIEELSVLPDFSDCEFYVFGLGSSIPQRLSSILSNPRIHLLVNPTDFEFQTRLSRLTILLNYRMKYNGETSLTTLEAMRYGVVPVIRDFGWYSELPSGTTIKVNSVDDIIGVLLDLVSDKKARLDISTLSQEYTRRYHSHKKYKQDISEFIDSTSGINSINNIISDSIKLSSTADEIKKIIRDNNNRQTV